MLNVPAVDQAAQWIFVARRHCKLPATGNLSTGNRRNVPSSEA